MPLAKKMIIWPYSSFRGKKAQWIQWLPHHRFWKLEPFLLSGMSVGQSDKWVVLFHLGSWHPVDITGIWFYCLDKYWNYADQIQLQHPPRTVHISCCVLLHQRLCKRRGHLLRILVVDQRVSRRTARVPWDARLLLLFTLACRPLMSAEKDRRRDGETERQRG